jgi:hypothetical protein
MLQQPQKNQQESINQQQQQQRKIYHATKICKHG